MINSRPFISVSIMTSVVNETVVFEFFKKIIDIGIMKE